MKRTCLISVTCDCPFPGLGYLSTLLFLSSTRSKNRFLTGLSSQLTIVAASNNCALYNLYYLVLFAFNARGNPYLV